MLKILYVCTHNRCRSVLSEAVTNALAAGRIVARSAGSQPVGEVHPLSLKYLAEAHYPVDGLRSQSWDEFADFDPDIVITVCDSAAGEVCPLWMGKSHKLHWGLQDPSKLSGTDQEVAEAFRQTINIIKNRVQHMLDAGLDDASREDLTTTLQQLGAE